MQFKNLKRGFSLMPLGYVPLMMSWKKEDKTVFRGKAKREAYIAAAKPYEVPFYGVIDDEGIKLGKEQTPFITNWYEEIHRIRITKNLLCVLRTDGVNAVFRKDSFVGASFEEAYAFMKQKKRCDDVLLADFLPVYRREAEKLKEFEESDLEDDWP
jgi:hypothetical protein